MTSECEPRISATAKRLAHRHRCKPVCDEAPSALVFKAPTVKASCANDALAGTKASVSRADASAPEQPNNAVMTMTENSGCASRDLAIATCLFGAIADLRDKMEDQQRKLFGWVVRYKPRTAKVEGPAPIKGAPKGDWYAKDPSGKTYRSIIDLRRHFGMAEAEPAVPSKRSKAAQRKMITSLEETLEASEEDEESEYDDIMEIPPSVDRRREREPGAAANAFTAPEASSCIERGLHAIKQPRIELTGFRHAVASQVSSLLWNGKLPRLGDRVMARYMASSRGTYGTCWFPGVITLEEPDGRFRVAYDDGDVERNVLLRFLCPYRADFAHAAAAQARRLDREDAAPEWNRKVGIGRRYQANVPTWHGTTESESCEHSDPELVSSSAIEREIAAFTAHRLTATAFSDTISICFLSHA